MDGILWSFGVTSTQETRVLQEMLTRTGSLLSYCACIFVYFYNRCTHACTHTHTHTHAHVHTVLMTHNHDK